MGLALVGSSWCSCGGGGVVGPVASCGFDPVAGGGMGVAKLVERARDAGGVGVPGPSRVCGLVAKRAASAVLFGPGQRAVAVAGLAQVGAQGGDEGSSSRSTVRCRPRFPRTTSRSSSAVRSRSSRCKARASPIRIPVSAMSRNSRRSRLLAVGIALKRRRYRSGAGLAAPATRGARGRGGPWGWRRGSRGGTPTLSDTPECPVRRAAVGVGEC